MEAGLGSVSGQTIVVTGGCGGIGQAAARILASRGAKVAVGDLDADSASGVAESLGGEHLGLGLDVSDPQSFADFLDRTEDALGPISGLVNNAGVMLLGPLEEESPESTAKTVEVNLIGVINGTRLGIQRMRQRGQGQIVNIASQAGKVGFPGGATYCATKFGVVGLSDATRNELAGTGIGVTCILPGPVRTELAGGIGQARGVRWLSPHEVGEAIADSIETGAPEVWLPPVTRYLQSPTALLPAKLRDRLMRAFRADAVLSGAVDPSARADYERKTLG